MMYGWIIGLLLIVILFLAVKRSGVFKRNPNSTIDNNKTATPLETLKNRYAKGEIDKEEFEKRKAELEKTK